MMADEHITVGNNLCEKVKIFKKIGLFIDKPNDPLTRKQNVDLRQVIHVIIQSKNLYLLHFSRKI